MNRCSFLLRTFMLCSLLREVTIYASFICDANAMRCDAMRCDAMLFDALRCDDLELI